MAKQRLKRWMCAGAILAALIGAGAARAEMVHRYSFSGDGTDSVGGAHGTAMNANAVITAAHLDLTANNGEGSGTPGIGGYFDMPNGIFSAAASNNVMGALTIEVWAQSSVNRNWAALLSAGTSNDGEDTANAGDNADYLQLIPQNGQNGLLRWTSHSAGVGPEGLVDYSAPLSTTVEQHLVGVVADGNIALYVDGEFIGSTTLAAGFDVTTLNDNNNWLGRSQWNDSLFDGTINEVRIHDDAVTPRAAYESFLSGPDNPGAVSILPITNIDIQAEKTTLFVQERLGLSILADSSNATDVELRSDPLLAWSSDDAEVLTVTQEGQVVGVRPGIATITANFDGVLDTVMITVDEVPDVLEIRHRYSFNSPAGEELIPGIEPDLVGSADAVTWGAQYLGDGTMELNPSETEPGIDPDQGYVDLPNGIISALNNGSFEAWVTPTSGGGNWQRVFDFGTTNQGEKDETLLTADDSYNGEDYIMLTRKIGASNIFQYEMNPPGGRPPMIITSPVFEEDVEYHLVGTYDSFGQSMALYVDGIEVGSLETDGTLLSQLPDVNNWLGRSNWRGDAFAYANFNEFRVWEGVLPALRIAINTATGPDNQVDDPGALVLVSLSAPTDTLYAETPLTIQLTGSADFAAVTGVPINSVPGTTFTSSDELVATVSESGVVSQVGVGQTTITLDYEGQQDTMVIQVVEVDKPITTRHRWSFNETSGAVVADSVGTANGTIVGTGATFADGELTLPGGPNSGDTTAATSPYVDLPNGMISVLPNAVSMEIWTTWLDEGLGLWQRIFSFGTSAAGEDLTNNGLSFANMIVRPNRYDFSLETGYELSGRGNTPLLYGGDPLVPGEENHIVVTWDFDLGFARLYLNGALVSIASVNDERTWADLDGLDVNVWFGRSQWTGDGMYFGRFNEIRIHEGIMNQDDVTASRIAGPDMEGPSEVPLGIELDGINLTLSWPTAAGGVVESTTNLDGGAWIPVDGTPVENNGTNELTVTPAEDFEAFRLGEP